MLEIVVTRGIREELDLRNLVVIAETIRTYEEEEDFDEFQVFEIKNNRLIHRQEEPEQAEEYILKGKFNNAKVWAVQGMDREIGKYWTIMFPEDY